MPAKKLGCPLTRSLNYFGKAPSPHLTAQEPLDQA